MTYFGFLAIFLGIPIILLSGLVWRDVRRNKSLPITLQNWTPTVALVAHILVALIYTTPWDNYLVATRVWWYDPNLVTGIVLGWVPIEEYTFFVLQPIFTGLWIFYFARRIKPGRELKSNYSGVRQLLIGILGLIWLGMAYILAVHWKPGNYLALELIWALPPIMLQLGFGADILWRHRRLVLMGLVPTTLYLSAADALAIASGTWTINPALSLQIYLGGILPLEEFIFFALTNIMLTFGMILVMSRESQVRFDALVRKRAFWLLPSGNN